MKRIVIVGAGFAGLAAAKALRTANADIVVIDRSNHNLFQPLLYQVATTVLSPAQIASPIRGLLKHQRNTGGFLGEVNGINKDTKFVYASNPDNKDAAFPYDFLVIATGVTHSYFGHDEFAEFAPGLKGLADAVRIRNKVLKAFEQAEARTIRPSGRIF
jgi:NADH dehydrogenase